MSRNLLDSETVANLTSMAKDLGRDALVSSAANRLYPHIVRIFTKYDADEVEKFILVDYCLVRNHTPPGVQNMLARHGRHVEETIMQMVTPEKILYRLEHPDEWVDEDTDEAVRIEMRLAAEIIRETPGGMAWLEREVLDLYWMAGIITDEQRPDRGST